MASAASPLWSPQQFTVKRIFRFTSSWARQCSPAQVLGRFGAALGDAL
jgi:hypothetical protein